MPCHGGVVWSPALGREPGGVMPERNVDLVRWAELDFGPKRSGPPLIKFSTSNRALSWIAISNRAW